MKKLIVVLLVLTTSAFASDRCYMLKEVMQDEKMGVAKICYYEELNICFFTTDHDWYTHSFQEDCKKFYSIERYVKNHPEINVKAKNPKDTP